MSIQRLPFTKSNLESIANKFADQPAYKIYEGLEKAYPDMHFKGGLDEKMVAYELALTIFTVIGVSCFLGAIGWAVAGMPEGYVVKAILVDGAFVATAVAIGTLYNLHRNRLLGADALVKGIDKMMVKSYFALQSANKEERERYIASFKDRVNTYFENNFPSGEVLSK